MAVTRKFFWTSIVTISLVAMALDAWTEASAGELYVHACTKGTCLASTHDAFRADMFISGVLGVSDSVECPGKCAIVKSAGGVSVHVMGNWLDITCRAWGGVYCSWNRVIFTPEILNNFQRQISQ